MLSKLPSVALALALSAGAAVAQVPATGPYTGGDLTWYNPSVGYGACGNLNADTDPVAALPIAFFSGYPGATTNPNLNPLCGRQIRITATPRGGLPVNITATIADACGGCAIMTSVDVAPVLFSQVTSLDVGRINGIVWDFV
ncbi:Barwin-like endoglucanase [Mycena kentingensis (nom. inval.)]|nr:Barwin-like endoglucanase [Mycena kentingensis (nom. inval.)]